jgi:hypothetical protein
VVSAGDRRRGERLIWGGERLGGKDYWDLGETTIGIFFFFFKCQNLPDRKEVGHKLDFCFAYNIFLYVYILVHILKLWTHVAIVSTFYIKT